MDNYEAFFFTLVSVFVLIIPSIVIVCDSDYITNRLTIIFQNIACDITLHMPKLSSIDHIVLAIMML